MEPKLKLFDMHSDTAIQLYRTSQDLFENDLQISLKKAEAFDKYVQLAAFFSYPN